MQIKGVILSTDGVLCDTSELRRKAWEQVAMELDVVPRQEDLPFLAQRSNEECLLLLCERSGITLSDTEKSLLIQRKREIYQQSLLSTPPSLAPDILNAMDLLKRRSYRLAAASASTCTLAILRSMGLFSYFDAVADGSDIAPRAAESYVFAAAAGYLNLPEYDCAVVESRTHRIPGLMSMGFFTIGLCVPPDITCSAYISNMTELTDLLQ